MKKKSREEGYYWITAWEERMIGWWRPDPFREEEGSWTCTGSDMDIPEKVITDINENRIIEDGKE